MRGIFVSRGIGFAVAALSLAMAGTYSQPVAAQTAYCWIDAKTGQPVPAVPLSGAGSAGFQNTTVIDPLNPNRASNPNTGKSFVRDGNGNWIDAQTGQAVPTMPLSGAGSAGFQNTNVIDPLNPNRASNPNTGQSFVRVPCPSTQTAASTGLYLGGELAKNWGWVRSTERLAATGVQTNQFTDTADPFGGGFVVGYNFAPWRNILVGPFGSFDFMRAPVNHTFAGGSFLGTTANFMGTAGVKGGPLFDQGVWVYGIAGVSVLNQSLNINFIPLSSSSNSTVPGATIGAGVAWQPSVLQGFGRPVLIFLEYEHTWWQSANFNAPTASPLFNYNFARQDDLLKFGFTVSLGDPRSAAPPPIIHK